MKIKVSDRVQEQQPLFIREDYTEFYTLLEEYYKSQQKTGRPYDIANNLIEYFDINKYNSVSLTNSTILLSDIGYYDNIINIIYILIILSKSIHYISLCNIIEVNTILNISKYKIYL